LINLFLPFQSKYCFIFYLSVVYSFLPNQGEGRRFYLLSPKLSPLILLPPKINLFSFLLFFISDSMAVRKKPL